MPVKEAKSLKSTKKADPAKSKKARSSVSKSTASSKKKEGASKKSDAPDPSLTKKVASEKVTQETPAPPQTPAKPRAVLDLVSSSAERRAIGEKATIEEPQESAEPVENRHKSPEQKDSSPSSEPNHDSSESGIDGNYIHIKGPIIVRELAEKMNLKPFQLLGDLMEINVFATINSAIAEEQAKIVCDKHGFEFGREKREKKEHIEKKVEEQKQKDEEKEAVILASIDKELRSRPPVVTFMGHVDHGKTSLLDGIRKARVAAGEAGGITQHIGAYTITVKDHEGKDQLITFLDTPGHAAFSAMRARGANVTDIVVLVVAADDGPMPQTKEAYSHAKAAKVKTIVAINKCDLPSVNIRKVQGQLMEMDLVGESNGGEIGMIEVSALKNTGVSDLLARILLEAEMLELKARDEGPAVGNVIESQIEQGRGATATVIVKEGTLSVGDAIRIGPFWGKIKALIDFMGKPVKKAGPSIAVKVIGLNGAPDAGAKFEVLPEKEARAQADEMAEDMRMGKLQDNASSRSTSMDALMDAINAGQKKTFNILIKSDVSGSGEAIETQLKRIKSDKISLDILHNAVGPITETDIILAKASEAIIFGFNVKVETRAAEKAKAEHIEIRLHNIIYELLQEVEDALVGKLDPEIREAVIGHAQVKQVFEMSKGGKVAGSVVTDGRISRSGKARVMRKKMNIYTGAIGTLRRFQDDVSEVRSGLECGLRLEGFNDYEEGDIIECYILEKVAQKL